MLLGETRTGVGPESQTSPDVVCDGSASVPLVRRERPPGEMQRPPEAATSLHSHVSVVEVVIRDDVYKWTEDRRPLLLNTSEQWL